MNELEYHPIANLFPLMEGEEYEAFKADIQEQGLRQPIWIWKKKIIDGRNRYRVCLELGIEPRFQEWDGKGSLAAFVVSLNMHRRHLSASQKAAIAADLLPMLEAEAKERQRVAGKKGGLAPAKPPKQEGEKVQAKLPEPSPQARDEAAKLVGASPRYVQDAKAVREADPALFEKVKAGEVTLGQAMVQLEKPKGPPPLQPFDLPVALARLENMIHRTVGDWPPRHRESVAHRLEQIAKELRE